MATKEIYSLQTNPWAVYDAAVKEFVATQIVGEAGKLETVPVVFATPSKEFANQKTLNPKNVDPITRKTPVEAPRQDKTVPYPTMGVLRFNPVFDWYRFRPLVERKLRALDRNRAWQQARYALPWDVQYQIDMRAKWRTHINQMVGAMMLKFPDPNMPLDIKWGEPYGNKPVFLYMETIVDNSILEVDDENQDRVFRATVTLTLKAWFVQKLTKTPTALHIFQDFYVIPHFGESVEEFEEDIKDQNPDISVETTVAKDGVNAITRVDTRHG